MKGYERTSDVIPGNVLEVRVGKQTRAYEIQHLNKAMQRGFIGVYAQPMRKGDGQPAARMMENFEFNPMTGDKDQDKKIKDHITRMMEPRNCDATGVRSFPELMETTLRAEWTDGGNLWVKRSDGTALLFEAFTRDTF